MKKIVLIGSGNVATHLGQALTNSGVQILQVWSRSLKNAEVLADALNAEAINEFSKLTGEADAYVFSVKDDALLSLINEFPFEDKVMLHTAGSVSMDIVQARTQHCGVLYPLQTFSKAKPVEFKEIPLLVEAGNIALLEELEALAQQISNSVHRASSDQRKWLHISAVFACNFVNHLFAIGQEILEGESLPFDLLRPLIKETSDKAQLFSPKTVQTGPAVRHDHQVMNAHLDMLEGREDLKQLYQLMSQRIMQE